MLHKEESLWVAECPDVGAFSQGSDVEDALANLKEATELYLEEFPLKDGPPVRNCRWGGAPLPAQGGQ